MFRPGLVLILAILQGTLASPRYGESLRQDIEHGRYQEAKQKLQQAIKKTPQEPLLWRQLGDVEVKLGDHAAAITAYRKARSLALRDPDVDFNLGALYLEKGATVEALEMYKAGLALDPANESANRNYAFLLMKTGKNCEAVKPLERVKGLRAEDLPVRVSLIESFYKCGNRQAGEGELAEFLKLPSATRDNQIKLAKVLAEDHLLEAAELTLQNVIRVFPDDPQAHAQLGALFLGERRFEDAARHLGRAVQLDPTSPDYAMKLAQVLLKAKQYPTALEFLNAVAERFGMLPEYQYKLAWAYYGLGQVPKAATELERLARHHPELDRVHYSLGNCYLALGRLAEAESQYRQAITLNAKRAAYHFALGQALRKQGNDRLGEAILELQESLELDPRNLDVRVELAICYEQTGEFDKAERLLEATVREQPNLVAAHRVLARVYYRQGKKERGDRESGAVSRLDSEESRRRAQMLGSTTPESFE